MKTYYDLTRKEREKYLDEFKKTPVGKEYNQNSKLIFVIASILLGISIFISCLTSDITSDKVNLFVDWIGTLGFLVFIIYDVYLIYINVNFTSWLKNKYDIKRW